ncbi:E3 ubiquitin-protein ligase RNF167 [Kryptolebias marmoratus]|uniref:RING-type E3 ubiquitin transferase n=1 Tax=Kryptolebias marmoratus TaxID=37003 RepID=A0A3Q3G1A7_KRYMA|nr:E3 ubiquitin-protein ligase RNF167 [Kryptolebias marmoratus]XP_017292453.1 E3 ubiquitin-protein ligase RNF167 [Kryptolebias marmoratus]XP_037835030.1 E3 ubiquitin-protein ligase RNF167 [Kryptolebias marmoratus]
MGQLGGWCLGTLLNFLILVFCSTLIPSPTHAYIYAHCNNMTTILFDDLSAFFGPPLPKEGVMGVLVVSKPLNGCTAMDPPPKDLPVYNANTTRFIALIKRFDCNFDIKVLNAQQAGYSAVIVHNVYSDILLNMNYSNITIAEQIQIPSVFTSYHAAKMLKELLIPEAGAYVILKPDFSFPIAYYLIPFTAVVGMVIIVMCVILIIRCVQYRKRLRKNRLTKEQLKKIPTHKFRKGDDYDVCAICLDEYEEGDKLRVLPCSHAYHCKCVDPWLTQTKKTCPVCKQRVTKKNPEHSESDSEEEAGGRREEGETEGEADSERTPLLRPSNLGSPSASPAAYSATTTTTAQCLASPAHCDSPILGHEGYYSPQEDTDSESSDTGDDDDTAQLIGRGRVLA